VEKGREFWYLQTSAMWNYSHSSKTGGTVLTKCVFQSDNVLTGCRYSLSMKTDCPIHTAVQRWAVDDHVYYLYRVEVYI